MKHFPTLVFVFLFISLGAIDYPNMFRKPHFIDGSKIPDVKPIMGDYLYIGETEVSNNDYLEFLYWLRREKPGEYTENLPDTLRWRDYLAYNEPFVNYYFRHPAYRDYPMVNISQRQAENFCKFKHYTLSVYLNSIKSDINEFIVRLPTEKEWILAAQGGIPGAVYPWGTTDIRAGDENKKHKGEILLNCKRGRGINEGVASKLNDNGFITIPGKSNFPNGYGLYNMSGNVAEWIAEKGKSKGGSWNLPPYNARIDVPGYHDGDTTAKSDIGFRYVVEIISVKDKPGKNIVVDAEYLSNDMKYLTKDSIFTKFMFASAYELTNREYNLFLKENNLPAYQIQSSRWAGYFPYKYYEMYGWHSAYDNYPVVNISYKAAKAYCEWATEKYNTSEKRKYKKVVFRLPSKKEWEFAASGGRIENMYPWGGPYMRNTNGCFLANFSPLEEQYQYKKGSVWFYNYPDSDRRISQCVDGLVIPGSVKTYFPNDYGLYNCAGNVAEMINDFGITKGGSWNSDNEHLEIRSKENYMEPSPDIGFRVFMEVLEK